MTLHADRSKSPVWLQGRRAARRRVRRTMALPLLLQLLVTATRGLQPLVGLPNCSTTQPGVCLTAAKPILQIIKGTHDPAACCHACTNDTRCVSWNVNSQMNQCFLRAVSGPTNPGKQCISGQTGRDGPPPPKPKPPPLSPSDQRPRFHFQPTLDATNDIQGPFYDPRHKIYHMGFAWHVNGTHGIGSAPNRWWHQVSKDLAHWQIVSTTPDRAMLKPDMPYDDLAVMTGSVTVVDGVPKALFSCRGSENRDKNWSSATVGLAQPADLSDPLLVEWSKNKNNPILNPGPGTIEQGFKPGGMPIAQGFRDPSTAWLSAGKWRVLTSCERCNGSSSALGLFSAPELEGPWEYTSAPLPAAQLECPDYWSIVPLSGNDELMSLSAIKLSQGGKERVYVGTMDEGTQTLTDLITPLVGGSPQLLDASTYASKSFYDPVNEQQIWTSWIRDVGHDCAHNASVCSSHTLLRSLLYDSTTKAHVTPPVAQTDLLRKAKLHSIAAPIKLGANSNLSLPAAVEASGMQLEIIATFALPLPAGVRVGVASRCSKDGLQRTDSFFEMAPPDPDNVSLHEAGVLKATVGSGQQTLSFALPATDTNVTLRVYVDHSVLETYAQGGRGVVTSRMYPSDDALGVKLYCEGPAGVTLLGVEVYEMDTIWVDKI